MRLRISSMILLGLILSACATIVEGTDQSIMVNLSPENATCKVTREGTQLASISGDNKFINISKSKNDLIIECEAPNHYDEIIPLESSASGWGVVGCFLIDLCITDYSTGALNKYPESINITLAPKTFLSPESRDNWYGERQKEIEGRWDDLIESKTTYCQRAANKADCQSLLSEMKEKKSEELVALEQRRFDAEITSLATQSTNIETRLAELKDLLDRRVITQEEYETKRSEILSEL
jgi:hypothetical protein